MNIWLLKRVDEASTKFSYFLKRMASASSENRLWQEKSPYLLQHKNNPVDWYPWGEDAFNAAKNENKLIFLSVGYSTCHWCHVMERESFENVDIAKIMNENFINVKVDREERPDVDKVYMTFVTSISGRGGWPMSVWLTPDLNPIYGGTYFPPDNRYYGQPGFPSVLQQISKQWTSDTNRCKTLGKGIIESLKKNEALPRNSDLPSENVFAKAFSQLSGMFEPRFGGFGRAPKFPQPSNFNFLFAYGALNKNLDDAKKGVEMCLHTLDMMDRGGIHDHVSQGFARYSTDEKWHVPHFEKMLYDQSQLVVSYLDAFLYTKDEKYSNVVHDILTYVTRDLMHPTGAFYSAEDADSYPKHDSKEKREGAFCVWTYAEVKRLLNERANNESDAKLYEIFNHNFNVKENGNVDPYQDPHDELKNQNVLIRNCSLAETASKFKISPEQCENVIKRSCKILFEERLKRPRPHLDDKMITAWNGMMLSASARAGVALNKKSYIDVAIKTARFIQENLYQNDGTLLRAAYKNGDEVTLGSKIAGFSDDYAWVIRGLTNLYEATMNDDWLQWAEKLQDKQNELFWDENSAGYFISKKSDEKILLKLKEDHDGAEPSVNSVSVINLIKLSRILNRKDFHEKATKILQLFSDRLEKLPASLPEMTTGFLMYSNPVEQIILSGDKTTENFKSMLEAVHQTNYNPNRVIMHAGADTGSFLYRKNEELKNYAPKNEDVAAYVCKDFTCSLAVKNVKDLTQELLKE